MTLKELRKELKDLSARPVGILVDEYEGEHYAEVIARDNKLENHYLQFIEGDEKDVLKLAKTWATKLDVKVEISN